MTTWPTVKSEAYCVDSGRPVRYEAGDRCIRHGNRTLAELVQRAEEHGEVCR